MYLFPFTRNSSVSSSLFFFHFVLCVDSVVQFWSVLLRQGIDMSALWVTFQMVSQQVIQSLGLTHYGYGYMYIEGV